MTYRHYLNSLDSARRIDLTFADWLTGSKLRVVRLAVGDRARTGDYWRDVGGNLVRLRLPWWQVRGRRLTEYHCEHYRIAS